jgi:hypothetical protein
MESDLNSWFLKKLNIQTLCKAKKILEAAIALSYEGIFCEDEDDSYSNYIYDGYSF